VYARGLGLKPPLELDILQKLYYLRKGDYCFRILFACLFVDFMQIPRNEFACRFQGTLQTGKKVIIIGFGGNLGYRLHPETISPLFADLLSTTHL